MLHPRSLLADIDTDSTWATEIAWREFYADVLWHEPASAWHDLKPALEGMRYDDPEDAIEAWRTGTTGYPIVDAGMRQLLPLGMDAQPRADDHRVLPHQGPARVVARRARGTSSTC